MTDAYSAPQADLNQYESNVGAITEGMVEALRGTKGWVLLIAILMYIGAAFMVLGGFGMMVGGAVAGAATPGMPQGVFTAMGAVYLLMALLYLFPATYLVKYSSAIGRLISDGRASDMEAALQQQRKFWKFMGVLALIFVVLMILGMVTAIALPMWIATHR